MEKEQCVRCGKETEYDANTPITVRLYFIEGAGQLCEECFTTLYDSDYRGRQGTMNPLKTYAKNRMKEFVLERPVTYDQSLYAKIIKIADIEFHFKYAENFISSCEKEDNAGRLPGYEEQDNAVYNAYAALDKVVKCMSDIPSISTDNVFDSITQEQFDSWCDQLHDFIKRTGVQRSRYASRPDC